VHHQAQVAPCIQRWADHQASGPAWSTGNTTGRRWHLHSTLGTPPGERASMERGEHHRAQVAPAFNAGHTTRRTGQHGSHVAPLDAWGILHSAQCALADERASTKARGTPPGARGSTGAQDTPPSTRGTSHSTHGTTRRKGHPAFRAVRTSRRAGQHGGAGHTTRCTGQQGAQDTPPSTRGTSHSTHGTTRRKGHLAFRAMRTSRRAGQHGGAGHTTRRTWHHGGAGHTTRRMSHHGSHGAPPDEMGTFNSTHGEPPSNGPAGHRAHGAECTARPTKHLAFSAGHTTRRAGQHGAVKPRGDSWAAWHRGPEAHRPGFGGAWAAYQATLHHLRDNRRRNPIARS